MSERDDGGTAFPGAFVGNYGMSVRDYFAAKALQGFTGSSAIARTLEEARGKHSPDEAYALMAYAVADAMLKERAK